MTTSQPGWYPDPQGRAEQRYFDGTQWTDNVSNAGVQSTDPVNAPATPAAGAPGWSPSNLTAGLGDAAKQVNADMLKKQPPFFFLIAGGALLMLIAPFMTWAKYDFGGGDELGIFASILDEAKFNGFDIGFTSGLGFLLLALLLLAYAAIRLLKLESKLPPQSMKGFGYGALGASGLATLITVFRILNPTPGDDEFTSRGFGLWIAFLASAAALVGAVMEFMAAKKHA
jgi:hypothetical protein